MTDYCVVLTTCGDRDKASVIAKALVERRLAACVQILPVGSVYTWKERVEEAQEILLLIKIKRADYAGVEEAILALHDYQTPEIVALPIVEGFEAYLDWVAAATRRKTEGEA